MSNWLTEAIARESAYDEGYEAGKQAAAEQLFTELEREVIENSDAWCYKPKDELLDQVAEFKKKYGVK